MAWGRLRERHRRGLLRQARRVRGPGRGKPGGEMKSCYEAIFGLKALNCAGRLLLDQDFPGLPQP
jgi:hypothetical protein